VSAPPPTSTPRGLPHHFTPAIYFAWGPERIAESLARLRDTPSVLVVLRRPADRRSDLYRVLNPEDQQRTLDGFLRDPASGFRRLAAPPPSGEGYALEFYAPGSAPTQPADFVPQQAEFGRELMVTGAAIRERTLFLRVRAVAAPRTDYRLLLHGVPLDRPDSAAVWDRAIEPPLSAWTAGGDRVLGFPLPPEYFTTPHRLQVGFFDERDAAHGWPPLPLASGRPFLTFEPGELEAPR
jgi:hypothetical protein